MSFVRCCNSRIQASFLSWDQHLQTQPLKLLHSGKRGGLEQGSQTFSVKGWIVNILCSVSPMVLLQFKFAMITEKQP